MIEHRVYGSVRQIDEKELKEAFERIGYIKTALLFGSRASGKYNRKSDYDFAVSAESSFEFGVRAEVLVDLSRILGIDMEDMDIVDLDNSKGIIIDSIIEDFIILKGDINEVYRLLGENQRERQKREKDTGVIERV